MIYLSAEELKQIDFNNDKQLIKVIKNTNSDLFSGKDIDGNQISLGIEKGKGIRVSTYQPNGWIRINEYTLEFDDENNEYIERVEMFTK